MTTQFLSFLPAAPIVHSTPNTPRATLTPCFRFTNSGQVTFLPAHHNKQLRPRKFDNNAADYDGLLCVDTVLDMYGADPAGDAEYYRTNLENYDADTDAPDTYDPEYQIETLGANLNYAASRNNHDYDNDMRNDAAAKWLRERGISDVN